MLELDCFAAAFSFLYDNLPHDEICYPPSEKAQAYMDRQLAEWGLASAGQETVEKAGGEAKTNMNEDIWKTEKEKTSAPETPKSRYPALIGLLGSAFGALVVRHITFLLKLF